MVAETRGNFLQQKETEQASKPREWQNYDVCSIWGMCWNCNFSKKNMGGRKKDAMVKGLDPGRGLRAICCLCVLLCLETAVFREKEMAVIDLLDR